MVKTILSQVKEYKRVSILTPVCMLGEVIMEMIIPLLMASIIDKGVSAGDIHHIKVTGLIMLLMAAISLTLGILSARFGAQASAGLAKNLRPEVMEPELPEFHVEEEDEFHVVRTKRFTVKPMTIDEAILQMNLLDHSFYVFRNVADDAVSVVYRRNNGGYGIIETQE